MEELILQLMNKVFPALAAGTVFPRWGVITRIAAGVSDGAVSDDDEPRFAVDVQALAIDPATGLLQPDGEVIYPSVPLPSFWVANNRGVFGFPQPGTRVLIQFVQGLPSHPVITAIYPAGRNLPAVGMEEFIIQQSRSTYIKVGDAGNIELMGRNNIAIGCNGASFSGDQTGVDVRSAKVRIGSSNIDLVEQVEMLAKILASHSHPGVSLPSQSSQINDVASAVASIKK